MLVNLTVATQDIGLLVFFFCLLGILIVAVFQFLEAHLFFKAWMTVLHSINILSSLFLSCSVGPKMLWF